MTYIRLIEKACPDVDFKREIFLGVIVKLTANKVKVLKFSSGEIVSFLNKNMVYFNDIIQLYKTQ